MGKHHIGQLLCSAGVYTSFSVVFNRTFSTPQSQEVSVSQSTSCQCGHKTASCCHRDVFPDTKLSLQLCVFDIFSPKKQWHDTCQRRPQTEVWKLSSGLRQLLLPPLSHINTHIQTKTQRHTATSTLSQTWKHQQPRTLANSANDKVTLCLCPCLFTFTYLFRIFWIHIQHFLETCWIHQYCIFAIFVVLVEFIS